MKQTLIASLIILLFISSCKDVGFDSRKKEGYIEYKITYEENNIKNISESLLPAKMVMKFNKDYSRISIDGFMGFVSINMITNYKRKEYISLLKFLDNKYAYRGSLDEEPCCFDAMKNMKIEFSEDTLSIANYLCKKATISYPENKHSFDVYYTDEIDIRNPNAGNPFKKIEGVLLDFQLKMKNVTMNMRATKVVFTEISEKEFKIPDEYKYIPKEKMSEIVNKILE